MALAPSQQTIQLHRDAPPKPALGAPCNGCGVCCAAETCPASLLLFRQRRGPCPALEWSPNQNRYHCGLVASPRRYLRWLPSFALPTARGLLLRWIAADQGCDCDFSLDD